VALPRDLRTHLVGSRELNYPNPAARQRLSFGTADRLVLRADAINLRTREGQLMSKKLFTSIAPLLALAALAVMPAAAQAVTQHWYRSGAILPVATPTPIVTYGGETNLSQNSGIGEINCIQTGGGTIENPTGGGAGIGRTDAVFFSECKAPQCEAEVKAKFGVQGRGTATTQNNPAATKEPSAVGWNNELEESVVAGVSSVREKIGEPFTSFKTPSPPGMIRATVGCEIVASKTPVIEAIFEGELKPEVGAAKGGNVNGTAPSKPSIARFNGPSTGALHSSVAGEGTNLGQVKFLGYNEQELITVRP
jgi:hypothetical protein